MAAILDKGRRWRTQFWKATTQGSFQQSLVEIGSVVSEEKVFFNFILLFSNLHNRSKSAKVQSSYKIPYYMLKSSSLCLYSLNLGTFWLKIGQFWPFEVIYIFSKGGHLGYRTALTDTILKEDPLTTISAKFGWDWLSSFRGEDFFNIILLFF